VVCLAVSASASARRLWRCPLHQRVGGERRRRYHADGRGARDRHQPPRTPLRLAPAQRIEANPEHPGDQLQLGVVLAVLARARIGGDRLGALAAEVAVGIELEAQRRREALLVRDRGVVRGVRFPADDQAEDAVLAPEPLEVHDLFVDPLGLGRLWRADHDLAGRLAQRLADDRAEVGRGGELLAVAEDRVQALGHGSACARRADQHLGRVVRLERAVQPVRPARIAVAVAQECPILRLRLGCAHDPSRLGLLEGCATVIQSAAWGE